MAVRNDEVKVSVQIDGKQAISTLGRLEMAQKEVVDQLKGMKKGTDEYNAASKQLDYITGDIKKLRGELGLTGMTVNQLTKYQRDLNKEMRNMTVGTEQYNKLDNELKQVNARLAETKKGFTSISDEAKQGWGFSTSFAGNLAANAAASGLDYLKGVASDIFDVTANFQKLEAVLTNTLGSKSSAQRALRDIKDFAAVTPYDVQQLTEAFVKLANQGFKPTNDELRRLGDLSASTGKGFDQLTEAVIDAQTGEFERLKEFGIRASKQGDQVTFTFKGVKKQVDFTNDSIREYILSLGDLEGVSGAMAAISETLGGKVSNLGDSYDSLMNTIGSGNTGPISGAIFLLNELVQGIEVALLTTEQIQQRVLETAAKVNGERILKYINEDSTALLSVKEKLNKENLTEAELTALNIQALEDSRTSNEAYIKRIQDKIKVLEKENATYQWGDRKRNERIAKLNTELQAVQNNVAGQTYALDALSEKEKAIDAAKTKAMDAKAKADAEAAKEREKQNKIIEKEIDDLTKKWQKLGDDIAKIEDDNYFKTLSNFERSIATTQAHYDKLYEETLQNEKRLLQLKVITQQQYDQRLAEIEALRTTAMNAVYDKEAADKLAAEQKLNEQLDTAHATNEQSKTEKIKLQHDLELAQTKTFYDSLVESANQFGLSTARIEEERLRAILNVNKKYNDEQQKDEDIANAESLAKEQAIYDAKLMLLTGFASLSGTLNSLIATNGEKQNNFQKTLTLIQIALNQAAALAAVVSGAAKAASMNPAGALYPIQIAGYVAAGTATVLTGVAQARAALAKANTVTAPTFSSSAGDGKSSTGSTSKNPQKAFAKGGYTVSDGGYVPSYQIASFGEKGPEWVMPNWMLREPSMANLVGILEGVRMRGFASGGFTDAPAASSPAPSGIPVNGDALMLQLIQEVKALRGDVRAQRAAIRAFIVYSDITDAEDLLTDIQDESSI